MAQSHVSLPTPDEGVNSTMAGVCARLLLAWFVPGWGHGRLRGCALFGLVGGMWLLGWLMGGMGAFGEGAWLLAQAGIGPSLLGAWARQRLLAGGFQPGWPFALACGRMLLALAGLLNMALMLDLCAHRRRTEDEAA